LGAQRVASITRYVSGSERARAQGLTYFLE
jgi:hypothetical protein